MCPSQTTRVSAPTTMSGSSGFADELCAFQTAWAFSSASRWTYAAADSFGIRSSLMLAATTVKVRPACAEKFFFVAAR